MSRLRPALTPEEWASRKAALLVDVEGYRGGQRVMMPQEKASVSLDHWGRILSVYFMASASSVEPALAVPAIALLNSTLPDTDPHKIDRADVEILDREYNAIMDALDDEYWDTVAATRAGNFHILANKLRALLPPEPK